MKKVSVLFLVTICLWGCEEYNDTASTEPTPQTAPSGEATTADEADEAGEKDDDHAAHAGAHDMDHDMDHGVGEGIHVDVHRLGRSDLCELLDPQLIRESFALGEDVKLQNNDRPLLCSYLWTQNGRTYRLGLSFSPAKPSDVSAARTQWEAVKLMASYKKHDQKAVEGVGDEAIWSTVDGGQLRVLSGSDIFFVTLVESDSAWLAAEAGVTPPKVNKMSADEVAEARKEARADAKKNAAVIAQKIVAKL